MPALGVSAKPHDVSHGTSLWVSLSVLFVAALALRLWGLGGQSFTSDEIWELDQARLSATEIIAAEDGFPPLYSLLLHGWLELFEYDSRARLLSVVLGALAVPAIWAMSVRLLGSGVGLWPALLLAISPYHIWYSQEARAYPLFFLAGVLTIWSFFRALQEDTRASWGIFALICAVGLYTHYLFALIPLFLGLILLLERRGWNAIRRPFGGFLVAGLAALSLIPLWLRDASHQLENYRHPGSFHAFEFGRTLYSFIAGHTLGPSIREVRLMSWPNALAAFAPWLVLVGGATALISVAASRQIGRSRRLAGIVILTAVPVAVCGLLANVAGIGYSRAYVVWAAAPLLAFLGLGIRPASSRWPGLVAVVALCLAMLLSVYQRHGLPAHRNADYAAAADYLSGQPDDRRVILTNPAYGEGPLGYYLGRGKRRIVRLPRVAASGADLDESLEVLAGAAPRGDSFWLLYGERPDGDPGGVLMRWLSANADLRRAVDFPGIELFTGRLPEPVREAGRFRGGSR